MKKILITLMIGILMIVSVAADDVLTGDSPQEFPQYVALDSAGNIIDENYKEPTFWSNLFGGNPFSFVDLDTPSIGTSEMLCVPQGSSNGVFSHKTTSDTKSGSKCSEGDFIDYKYEDPGNSGHEEGSSLFSQFWKKGPKSDSERYLPNFINYPHLKSKTFSYSYQCYECDVELSDDFEKSCLSKDRTKCVKTTDSRCKNGGIDYKFEAVCEDKKWGGDVCDISNPFRPASCFITNAPKVRIKSVSALPQVIEGKTYQIRAVVEVQGHVPNLVVESGIDFYGNELSVLSSSKGACGDSSTIGVKTNAKDETIEIRLNDVADVDPGKYKIKIAAFSDCGGSLMDEDSFNINIKEAGTPDIDVKCYYCDGNKGQVFSYVSTSGKCYSGQYKDRDDVGSCDKDDDDDDDKDDDDDDVEEEEEELECQSNLECGEEEICVENSCTEVSTGDSITCYYCDADEMLSMEYIIFEGEEKACPEGYESSEVECSAPCNTGDGSCEIVPICDGEDCSKEGYANMWSRFTDYKNNPKESYSILGFGVIILILLIYVCVLAYQRYN